MEPAEPKAMAEVPLVPVQFRFKFRSILLILKSSSASSAFLEKPVNPSSVSCARPCDIPDVFTCPDSEQVPDSQPRTKKGNGDIEMSKPYAIHEALDGSILCLDKDTNATDALSHICTALFGFSYAVGELGRNHRPDDIAYAIDELAHAVLDCEFRFGRKYRATGVEYDDLTPEQVAQLEGDRR
jgi:hypothetical protein